MNSTPQHASGSEKANFVRINYGIESNSFLERAKNQLREFDETRPCNLFYAALELRMGIEARLFEFIRGALKQVPRNLRKRDPQHIFGKLLNIAPEARKPIEVGIAITFANESNDPVRLTHTPVTEELLKCYSELGKMLHFSFFEVNKHLFSDDRDKWSESGHGTKPLLDYKDALGDICFELEKSVRGPFF